MAETIPPGIDIDAFISEHRIRFVRKERSRLCCLIAFVVGTSFMGSWMCLGRTIYYPGLFREPLNHRLFLEHEFYHVIQRKRLWLLHDLLYLLFPVPFGLSWYRWRCERSAYLHNIRHHGIHVEGVVSRLGSSQYGWCWPRAWMRRWFLKQLEK